MCRELFKNFALAYVCITSTAVGAKSSEGSNPYSGGATTIKVQKPQYILILVICKIRDLKKLVHYKKSKVLVNG